MRRATAIALLACLAVTADADASRKPTPSERVAILVAIDKTGRFSCDPAVCRRVVRVSTARRGWAAIHIRPRPAYRDSLQSATSSAKRCRGRWRAHQIGNGGGCDVPAVVVRDLRLACY